MKIKTKVHTIFMLIGPSGCGKTTFSKKILIPKLNHDVPEKNFLLNVQYLSSDEIRQEILGHHYDKHSSVMLESSSQAFPLLYAKLRAVTSYPVNAEFVVLDTTGMSASFREQVLEIAKENHYNVELILFDYKNQKDYYAAKESKKVSARHTHQFHRDVLPSLKRSDFAAVHKIKEKDFTDETAASYEIEIENITDYLKTLLPAHQTYCIIGDVHEKTDAFKELLELNDFPVHENKIISTPKNQHKKIVLLGDWIDKGKGTKEIVSFLHENKEWFYLVKGNHENFVSKYITGEIRPQDIDPTVVSKHFDSIATLKEDEDLSAKFLSLVSASCGFYRFIGYSQSSFIATHAPCKKKYLGKMSSEALRKQRNFIVDRSNQAATLENQLAFLQEECSKNEPYHVFGHVASKNRIALKNKLGIDTGIVYGNKLTSVTMEPARLKFKTVQSIQPFERASELPVLFKQEKSTVDMDSLSYHEQKQLNYIISNKVNFISGTMSPADKDVRQNELESLSKGLLYFKNKGITHVVIQPKYMGSRATIYLSLNMDDCFASSRKGFKINHPDLPAIFDTLLKKYKDYMVYNNISVLILDGELLPWSLLGKELIAHQFQVTEAALDTELSFLTDTHFDKHFSALKEELHSSDFLSEQTRISKKDLTKKHGHAQYSTFKQAAAFLPVYVPQQMHKEALEVFKEQLSLYSQETEATFKPFAILKMILNNGSEMFFEDTVSEMFRLISSDEYLLLDLTAPNYEEIAQQFYNTLTTDNQMEGAVIKPNVPHSGVAPYMKVRNPAYLSLIYGYDYQFPHKYEHLMKQKKIEQKLKKSMKEFYLGMKMLQHPLSSISSDNQEYKQLVADMLFETKENPEIDPRL